MAKLSRRAPSSAATPSTATASATTASTATKTPPTTRTTASHARGSAQAEPLQRITRASNPKNPQVAALVDPDANGILHEPSSASPAPPAYPNHNSNTAAAATSPAPVYAHAPTSVTATPYMPLLPPGELNLTEAENAAERARIRAEFFATYDVMTGVRIAATLGGFFGLMVFLIVWKSRSSSNETLKVLKDPKMAAVAAVCMQEEEERELQEAIVATGMSIYPDEYDALVYRRQRMLSLGNVSAPPLLNRGYRCASVGKSREQQKSSSDIELIPLLLLLQVALACLGRWDIIIYWSRHAVFPIQPCLLVVVRLTARTEDGKVAPNPHASSAIIPWAAALALTITL